MQYRELLRVRATPEEQELALPPGVTRLVVVNRSRTESRVALTSGVVADDGGEVVHGAPYDTGRLTATYLRLFYAADVAGTILEVFAYHTGDKSETALGPGFSDGFGV